MKLYKVPADTKEKEKSIGGVLMLAQFLWLLVGLVLGLVSFVVVFGITKSLGFGLFVCLVFMGISLPFAFKKKRDLPLATYLRYKRTVSKQTAVLINKGKEGNTK